MRKLKMTLADNKVYTFSTLTRKQIGAVQKQQRDTANSEAIKKLVAKEEKEGLSVEEALQLDKLQNHEENSVFNMIRMSLSAAHPEFTITNDEDKELELSDKLQGLMDMRDMTAVSQFAITGVLKFEEDKVVKSTDIDLS